MTWSWGAKPVLPTATIMMNAWRQRSAAVPTTLPVRLSVAYQRFGGWYDGNNDALILDNTQTGLQHSDRLDVMGTGTIEIDENRQLQLVTQYYKSQGDDYGLYLGKNMSAVTGDGKAFTTDGLNSDRVPGTERHLISLQYSDADFLGQNLVSQVYYRDESLTFYPFPTLSKGQVSSFSSSKQDTDQYGAKITLNSQPLDGWDLTWGVDADHETFNANQMFFDLGQSMSSGGLNNQAIYTTVPLSRLQHYQPGAVPAVQL